MPGARNTHQAPPRDARFQCDSCDHEVSGYSRRDLLDDGWRWHDAGTGLTFPMCGQCCETYARRRQAKADADQA